MRNDKPEINEQIVFSGTVASGSADNNSIFRDSSDNEIKIKDNSGSIYIISKDDIISSIGEISLNYYPQITSTNTSVTTNKLVDSTASFDSKYLGKNIYIKYFALEKTSWTGDTSSTLRHTFIFGSSSSGILIPTNTFSNVLYSPSTMVVYCDLKYYYTDATTDTVSNSISGPTADTLKTYINSYPAKEVYKVEIYTRSTGGAPSYGGAIYNNIFDLNTLYATVTNVDNSNTLTLDTDIFLDTGMTYEVTDLNENYTILSASDVTRTLSDTNSIFNGISLPIIDSSSFSTQKTELYFMKIK